MNVRKIIQEEVSRVLSEGIGMAFGTGGLFASAPITFNHLKWELNDKQKFYLDDLCSINPDSITESDLKDASKRLGIPEKNVKSIINTYTRYKPGNLYTGNPSVNAKQEYQGDSEAARGSALTFGNKPASAVDIGLGVDVNKLPGRTNTFINNNPPKNSKLEMSRKYDADMLNRTWYREGEGKEHPSKNIERMYESLTQSLMLYLYCESMPKDINLREDDKIQIDFEPVIEEGKFNQLGRLNYETEKYKEIKKLVETFNEKFGCSYIIYDHVNLEGSQRIYVEHNITKQTDMSTDSMKMMKKFLLPKIMMGQKIAPENAEIASLLGLDAGDTTWLYGPLGQTPQSGIISKR